MVAFTVFIRLKPVIQSRSTCGVRRMYIILEIFEKEQCLIREIHLYIYLKAIKRLTIRFRVFEKIIIYKYVD